VSDYIKNGRNEAIIEIELQAGKHAVVISRIIKKGAKETSGGSSDWALNGRTVNSKEVRYTSVFF
jgi:hypothetical protein